MCNQDGATQAGDPTFKPVSQFVTARAGDPRALLSCGLDIIRMAVYCCRPLCGLGSVVMLVVCVR